MGDRDLTHRVGPCESPVADPSLRLPATDPAPGYWTIEQFAAFVSVPKKTIYKWPAQYPTLPVLAMGTGKRKTWLFPIERVKLWLQRQEQGQSSRPRVHPSCNPATPNGATHA